MSRHVPRRRGDPPRGAFEPLPFHGWYECRECSAVVVDWGRHQEVCHGHEDQAAEPAPLGPGDLAERANAEGRAVVTEFARPRLLGREAWRQVAACLRLRPPKGTRPAATDPPAAGRAEQWARIDALIKRTTEA